MTPDVYIYCVYILIGLAIADLIVGVSNDAVNFLNSAIGSRVAPRHIIMVVASIGIFLGATFSSGMMEVARKGIFNPQLFTFADVMVVFLAVMLTDIILLDLFNTFGMPTSTTVSIVFELLGAATAVAIFKVLQQGESFASVGQYINASSTVTIVSGIFISVAIAFTVGTAAQWISRLIFSFHYTRRMRWFGGIWSGLAMAIMSYFLLFKGLKGASFVSNDFIHWVNDHINTMMLASFLFWTVLMQALISFLRVNVLRLVVLFGTFSLAMAFAGNDLVNFIGVPLAGLDAFQSWKQSGMAPDAYAMESLSKPVVTNTYILLMAGLIMIVTLWLSRKARTVTDTEVNLGRQDDGSERFSPNLLARSIVWYTRKAGSGIYRLMPSGWLEKAEASFQPVPEDGAEVPGAAFDLIRASVNLTAASALIAFATSLKLPLSTTYVSFMVAMGTSLADRAWGRGSAVYRVAGVLNVIGGWFLTAIIAFSASALFACFMWFAGFWGVMALLTLAFILISRTYILHSRGEKKKAANEAFQSQRDVVSVHQIVKETTQSSSQMLGKVAVAYRNALLGLCNEDRAMLASAKNDLIDLQNLNEEAKHRLYQYIRRFREESAEASRLYLLVYDLEQDMLQSVRFIVDECEGYVANSLPPVSKTQADRLKNSADLLENYITHIAETIGNQDYSRMDQIYSEKTNLFKLMEASLKDQVDGIKSNLYGMRNSTLLFGLELETKDLIAIAARFAKLFYRMESVIAEPDKLLVAGGNE